MGYIANFIVYTLAMVGVMGLALWAFKSFALGGSKSGGTKYLRVIDSMNIAPRKTLYIVSAGSEKFLIAGDIDRTTLISKLGEQTEIKSVPTSDFKEVKHDLNSKTQYVSVMRSLAEKMRD